MKKLNPIISTLGGYSLVLAAAAILLAAPCGPGCEWPIDAVTSIYSLGIIAFKYKDRVVKVTGVVLLILSVTCLSVSLTNRIKFQQRMRNRIEKMKSMPFEKHPEMSEDTEPTARENASRPTP